jgi:cell wall-associated NlpC family hydrolase
MDGINLLYSAAEMRNLRLYRNMIMTASAALFICSCGTRRHLAYAAPEETVITEEVSSPTKVELPFQPPAPLSAHSDGQLVRAISKWLNAPYRYGGNTMQGTDCSGFAQVIYQQVFNKSIPRSSNEIYLAAVSVDAQDMRQGDLLFFKIGTEKVSHVGIYLESGYFVHASTRKGVIISSLKEPYYEKYFFSAGRIL